MVVLSSTRRWQCTNAATKLSGLTIAVKANFAVAGQEFTASSAILASHRSGFDATVVARLRQAGGTIADNVVMDEFGMGSFNKSARNPWSAIVNADVTAGGSSGGSAAAVASGKAFAALGSDTGGSVRLPAAFCGVVGFKPTYGRLSRYGLIAYASSLDCPGIIAGNVTDAARVLEIVDGFDARDCNSVRSQPFFADQGDVKPDLTGVTIGIPNEFHVAELGDEARETWQQGIDWAEELGARVVSVSIPSIPLALPVYYVIAPAEASSNLSRYDGLRYGPCVPLQPDSNYDDVITANRTNGFGPEVRRRILIGTFLLSNAAMSDYFVKAQRIRAQLMKEFRSVFLDGGVDCLLTPTALTDAPTFADIERGNDDHLTTYANDVMTVPASLTGLPAISLPARLSSRSLPLGIQLIGNAFDEQALFRIARVMESRIQFPSLQSML